jgi:hypothetical protein
MKGFTVEKNFMYVISVGKLSFIPVPSEDIIGHTVNSIGRIQTILTVYRNISLCLAFLGNSRMQSGENF